MGTCETCGNEYHRPIEVTVAGRRHIFDSFECAIHKLAPECDHCGIRIIGHGIEGDGKYFCCANCARMGGLRGAVDHPEGAGSVGVR
jgi:hypothetical protein